MKKKSLKLAAMMLVPAALLACTGCSSTPQTQTETMNAVSMPEGVRGGVVWMP